MSSLYMGIKTAQAIPSTYVLTYQPGKLPIDHHRHVLYTASVQTTQARTTDAAPTPPDPCRVSCILKCCTKCSTASAVLLTNGAAKLCPACWAQKYAR